MIIGIPTEIKPNENRVALVPGGGEGLVHDKHQVLVESGAGVGSGFPDELYTEVGCEIVGTAEEVWARARNDNEGERAN